MSFTYMIFVPLGIIAFLSWQSIDKHKAGKYAIGNFLATIATILGVFVVIFSLFYGIVAYTSFYDVEKLEKFYRYEYNELSKQLESITENVSMENYYTMKAYVSRREELTDEIKWYNDSLVNLRNKNEMLIIGDMYYNVPSDLRRIESPF